MKVKKSVLEQIIREEATKFKTLMILKEEKQKIIKELNELYAEDESTMLEGDEILDLIPDANDKQAYQQAKQQPHEQPQAQAQPMLEEGFGGVIGSKINAMIGKIASNPQFQNIVSALSPKFAGKTYPEIYKIVKGDMSTLKEGSETSFKSKLENMLTKYSIGGTLGSFILGGIVSENPALASLGAVAGGIAASAVLALIIAGIMSWASKRNKQA